MPPELSEPALRELLAGTHVAVVGIMRETSGPLLAPVWYEYLDGTGFRFVMSPASAKARRLAATGRATICVQEDRGHYCYVTAEGPVTCRILDDAERYEVMLSIARRYLGPEGGLKYAEEFDEPVIQLATLVPERWHSEDVGDPAE